MEGVNTEASYWSRCLRILPSPKGERRRYSERHQYQPYLEAPRRPKNPSPESSTSQEVFGGKKDSWETGCPGSVETAGSIEVGKRIQAFNAPLKDEKS